MKTAVVEKESGHFGTVYKETRSMKLDRLRKEFKERQKEKKKKERLEKIEKKREKNREKKEAVDVDAIENRIGSMNVR